MGSSKHSSVSSLLKPPDLEIVSSFPGVHSTGPAHNAIAGGPTSSSNRSYDLLVGLYIAFPLVPDVILFLLAACKTPLRVIGAGQPAQSEQINTQTSDA